MYDLHAVAIPRDLYYHEIAYVKSLEQRLIESTAELIYLRLYGKDGAKWEANDSKPVWLDMARQALKGTIR